MKRVPIGFAILVLILQIFIYFGDGSCGANCQIDKEYLGMTIIANIVFLIIGIVQIIRDRTEYPELFGNVEERKKHLDLLKQEYKNIYEEKDFNNILREPIQEETDINKGTKTKEDSITNKGSLYKEKSVLDKIEDFFFVDEETDINKSTKTKEENITKNNSEVDDPWFYD